MRSVEALAVPLLGTLAAEAERVADIRPRGAGLAPSSNLGLDVRLDVVEGVAHAVDANTDVRLVGDGRKRLGGGSEGVLAGFSAERYLGRRHASMIVDTPAPCQDLLTLSTPPGEPRLTPAGELAKSVIRECSACKGKHWCPNCEDRRDALASAVESLIADVVTPPVSRTEGGDRP